MSAAGRLCAIACLLQAWLAPALAAAPNTGFDLQRADITAFIADTAARNNLPAEDIRALLADARRQSAILEAMQRPAEQVLPWWQYRSRFLDQARLTAGLQFWQKHYDLLARVEQERGVPAEYLVAILGVETQWGRITGRYRVLDALTTLGFDYPARGAYFRKELEQLLLLAHETQRDARSLRGSYAGAMGAPQFMPSSYRAYAVDQQAAGAPDLWEDWGDITASIANFLVVHGWQVGQPVMADTRIAHEADDPFEFQLILNDTLGAIKDRGYSVDTAADNATAVVLVPAEQADSMQWRVGFKNFWVITRYNRSPRYAMAVHDLALALRAGMNERDTTP